MPARRLAVLTARPVECLKIDTHDDGLILIGSTAFNDPLLLGGQAARAGLSCASCHRSGQGNPDFNFPGLSSTPGSADVTASLMSSHRGDGVFNPKPIPDLTHDNPKISRDPTKLDLVNFLVGLITKEFDGAPPPPQIIDGIAAYVRALDPAACKGRITAPFRLENAISGYVTALMATSAALELDDRQTAIAMLRGARSALAVIDARYQEPGLENARNQLSKTDIALQALQQALRTGTSTNSAQTSISDLRSGLNTWSPLLAKAQSRSLFNPKILAKYLR